MTDYVYPHASVSQRIIEVTLGRDVERLSIDDRIFEHLIRNIVIITGKTMNNLEKSSYCVMVTVEDEWQTALSCDPQPSIRKYEWL